MAVCCQDFSFVSKNYTNATPFYYYKLLSYTIFCKWSSESLKNMRFISNSFLPYHLLIIQQCNQDGADIQRRFMKEAFLFYCITRLMIKNNINYNVQKWWWNCFVADLGVQEIKRILTSTWKYKKRNGNITMYSIYIYVYFFFIIFFQSIKLQYFMLFLIIKPDCFFLNFRSLQKYIASKHMKRLPMWMYSWFFVYSMHCNIKYYM